MFLSSEFVIQPLLAGARARAAVKPTNTPISRVNQKSSARSEGKGGLIYLITAIKKAKFATNVYPGNQKVKRSH